MYEVLGYPVSSSKSDLAICGSRGWGWSTTSRGHYGLEHSQYCVMNRSFLAPSMTNKGQQEGIWATVERVAHDQRLSVDSPTIQYRNKIILIK